MSLIRFDKVTFGYADIFFKQVTLNIGTRDRIGIVGNNGCGKSTFLNCIAGLVDIHEGKITCQKGLKFGLIEQELPKHLENKSLYQAVSDSIPNEEKDYSMWKVDVTLDAFKATSAMKNRRIKELSGGWQRLALIARTVLSNPDILLLDEPTNHLDVGKIFLLEQWLNEHFNDIPFLSVSHDRSFLANCTNKTLFLRGSEIIEYQYTYEQAVKLLQEEDTIAATQRSKEIKEMTRLKRSAHQLRQIGVNNYSAAALKKSNQIAKRAAGIETKLTTVYNENKRDIKLSNSGIHTKRLIGFDNVDIFSPDGSPLFHIDRLDIMQGERLVIFGKNGCGKSQLLKTLYQVTHNMGDVKTSGITMTGAIKLGYIDQHMSHLPLQSSLRDYFNETLSQDHQKTTGSLINAGFPVVSHNMKLALLSPGQRARVAFLALHLLEPNFYVMDEPTNHLDISGQEQLEAGILENNATSIIVSHDRKFSQNIGTIFYMIRKNNLIQIESPETYYEEYCELKSTAFRKR